MGETVMIAERSQRLESLFASAVELKPEDRASFLLAECADDPSLRSEVEALLAADEQADNFVEKLAQAARAAVQLNKTGETGASDEAEADSNVERRIGPYRTIRRIGVGGMGAVYLAARDDDEFKQLVAVKVIRRGMDHEAIIRRFRHERQILAGLNHPNIARLLDGGATEDGLPWFALEYVEGLPLAEYCDERRLSINERLRLFLTVCVAVQYAHQNLVIHRDLKPSNILITPSGDGKDGEPKLLDFGIAKLLHAESSDETLDLTLTGMKPMTPAYASPEQARGKTIKTASDVYSLGVILYELLTRRRPYHVTSRMTESDIARVICEQEPVKPSLIVTRREEGDQQIQSKTEVAKLARQLRGDLDNIVLKALAKEPSQRYSSVEQFAEDIRRHLSGQPVKARPATMAYRGLKFARRNKPVIAFTAILVLALIGGVVAATWQSRIARAQAEQAGKERRKAERISSFLQNVFSYAEPNAGGRGAGRNPDVKLEDALRDAEKRLEGELKDEPETRADLYITIGKVWLMRGDHDAAERDFRNALNLRRRIHGERHAEVARCLLFVNLARHRKGEPDEGDALGMMLETDPENDRLAWMIAGQAVGYASSGDFATADKLFGDATARFHKKFGTRHLYNVYVLLRQADAFMMRGDLDRAMELYRQSFDIMRQAPPDAETINALTSVGLLEMTRGNHAEAEKTLLEALRISEQYLGPDYPLSISAWLHLTSLYFQQQNYTQAEMAARHAAKIAREKYPPEHHFSAEALGMLSKALIVAGKPRQALPHLQEATEKYRRLRDKSQSDSFTSAGILGECLTLLKRDEEAERLLKESYDGFKPIRGARSPEMVEARRRLAQLYDAWGKPEQAAQYR
jgi:serine/threonine-protein kinase